MTYTVTQLITQAFYVSGIISRDFESVPGSDASFGLQVLNDLLGQKMIDDKYIPYYTTYEFDAVIGQEEYFIENLIDVDTFVFYLQTVRFATTPQNRRDYFGSSRAENVNSLPYEWHIERTLNGSNLFLYFTPDQEYPLQIWGKFGLEQISSTSLNLEDVYDRYYIRFLKYELAEALCAEYNMDFPAGAVKTLNDLRGAISKKSAKLDLSLRVNSTLSLPSRLSYAQVNLGGAWTSR